MKCLSTKNNEAQEETRFALPKAPKKSFTITSEAPSPSASATDVGKEDLMFPQNLVLEILVQTIPPIFCRY